jgi:hypothetical protein
MWSPLSRSRHVKLSAIFAPGPSGVNEKAGGVTVQMQLAAPAVIAAKAQWTDGQLNDALVGVPWPQRMCETLCAH